MKIDSSLLSRLEKLSRIRLGEKDRGGFLRDVNAIIEYADKLSGLDAIGGAPDCASDSESLRADVPSRSGECSALLENASETKDGCFFAARTVE